jgi:hypothetical protein
MRPLDEALAHWHECYMLLGTAAGTLVGLGRRLLPARGPHRVDDDAAAGVTAAPNVCMATSRYTH